jgi:hypothetical protein
MLRHVALFRFRPGLAPEAIAGITRALEALPAEITTLRSYVVGPDEHLADGTWDYAVVADFDDEDAWRSYQEHPAHQRVLRELILPAISERAAVQLSWG